MRPIAWLLVLLANLSALAADDVRTWTDVSGRKLQAQFVREVDGDVTFIKDGKLITLPLDQLSDEDQKFIREAEANKKVEESTPPAGAPRKDAGLDSFSQPLDANSSSEAKSSLVKGRNEAETRTWRDFRGRQSVGKFVRMHQGNVVLMSGARALSVPFYSLSRADREYVRELLAARGESGQIPAAPPEDPLAPTEPPPAGELGPGGGAIGNAPPVVASAPVAGGGAAAGRGGMGIGSDANERLAKMQEENQKRMAEANERREKMAQQTAAVAQQSMQRMKSSLLPSQQESPSDIVGSCSNCKKGITREHSGGIKCPHCGVIWEYEVDEFGHKKEIPGAAAAIAAGEGSSSTGQAPGRTGWEIEPRHYVKLFTRIIIPVIVMLFAAIAAAVRGRR